LDGLYLNGLTSFLRLENYPPLALSLLRLDAVTPLILSFLNGDAKFLG